MTHPPDHHLPVRWFLDIDGTLSPYGLAEPWLGPTLFGGPADSDLTVPYRPDLVQAIQRLHESGIVGIVWLTTWEHDMADVWTEVGLGPFPMVPRPNPEPGRWWKADAVRAWMRKHPTRRAVWTDDDITCGDVSGLDQARLFAISPNPAVGLTDNDLSRIAAWATA